MIYEELGLSGLSLVLLAGVVIFIFWLSRYAESLRRDAQENRTQLEEDMRELEEAAKTLEEDVESLYQRLDSKVDQVQLELRLDEIERKRAQLIQKAVEMKQKMQEAKPAAPRTPLELRKKAQVSVELIAIFTLLLIPIVAGFIYAYSAMSDSMKYKADVALDRIAVVSEKLYVEGPGASAIVYIDLPSGIDSNSSYIGNSSGGEGRYLKLNISGSESFRILDANVSGNWRNATGGSVGKVSPGFTVMNLTVSSSGCVIIVPR